MLSMPTKRTGGRGPMEEFARLFGSLLAFVYHCFDRIVILGHLPLLTRPENTCTSFVTCMASPPSPRKSCASAPSSKPMGRGLRRQSPDSIEWAEKGVRKEDYVR